MRNEKVIPIAKKEITVKEITVREIRTFWQDMETEPKIGIEGLYNVLSRFIPVCMTGMTVADLDDMTPSEIKTLYSTFQEVNVDFFEAARMIEGEDPILVGLREVLKPLLMMRFAGFFPTAIPGPGITDSASSAQPSEP